jgi:hypothetical protein
VNPVTPSIQPHHVALLEVDEAIGHRQQGMNVGGEVMLVEADAEHQRAAGPGPHYHARLLGPQDRDREGSAQARGRLAHRAEQVLALDRKPMHQVHHDLGIGIRLELVTAGLQLLRSSSWFSMMPLCTRAMLATDRCGCALTVLGTPCVAQRVCAMPQSPASGVASSSASRSRTLPWVRRRSIAPFLCSAMPAES